MNTNFGWSLDGRSSLVYRAELDSYVQPVGWTSDGARLVALVRRPDKTWAVGTLPATGGRFTALRSFGWSDVEETAAPRMSPDGRFIAYQAGEPELRDVHVVSLDGRVGYQVTDDPADEAEPIWSPDGRRIAFKRSRLGSVSLWSVEVKDGRPVGQPVKLKDGMESTRSITWSSRGIFYLQKTSTSDLYNVAVDPAEGRPIGPPRLIPYSRTGRNVSPVWSPDAASLAFLSSAAADSNRRSVVVMPADGGRAREFLIPTTSWKSSAFLPSDLRWFGDGRGLGFSGMDSRGAPAVFRLTLETGKWDTIPLPAEVDTTRTEWNNDGSAFYYAQEFTANPGIFIHPVNGNAERPVYRASSNVQIRSLEFSPDRKWLAIGQLMLGNSTWRILTVNVETGETRTLVDVVRNLDVGGPHFVGWTPSGDLLVERFEAATSGTVILPLNGGAPRPISIPDFPPNGPDENPLGLVVKWSPDGRSMVIGRRSHGWEAFVIENPLASMRATAVSR